MRFKLFPFVLPLSYIERPVSIKNSIGSWATQFFPHLHIGWFIDCVVYGEFVVIVFFSFPPSIFFVHLAVVSLHVNLIAFHRYSDLLEHK